MSDFEKTLNALERVTMQQGYNMAVEDIEKILIDSINSATTSAEMVFALKIQSHLHQMSEVRFPTTKERQN